MERYIGLDAHGTSCTFGVIGPSGRKLRHDVVETHGAALVNYLRSIPGRKHLCLEEGTQSAWLYETLSPHVEEIVVAGITDSRGQKSDTLDAGRRFKAGFRRSSVRSWAICKLGLPQTNDPLTQFYPENTPEQRSALRGCRDLPSWAISYDDPRRTSFATGSTSFEPDADASTHTFVMEL